MSISDRTGWPVPIIIKLVKLWPVLIVANTKLKNMVIITLPSTIPHKSCELGRQGTRQALNLILPVNKYTS